MKTKIFIGLVLSIFGLTFLVASGVLAAKKARHKPPLVLPIDGAQPPQAYVGPSPIMYEGAIQPDCEDIHPTGYFYVIQHEQFGSTYYDYQSNGSMGRMIAVSTAGERSMVFHETRGDYWVYPRYITYNCLNPLYGWCGPQWVDGGEDINAGYGQMLLLHDGREIILYHRQAAYGPPWHSALAVGDIGAVCGCFIQKKYDIPNDHDNYVTEEDGYWPKGCVVYDAEMDTDYIHILTTESTGGTAEQTIAYQRCYFQDTLLICSSPGYGPYIIPPNVGLEINPRPIAVIDTIMTISAIVVSSPVSNKVAIVWTHDRSNYDVQVNNMWFISSRIAMGTIG